MIIRRLILAEDALYKRHCMLGQGVVHECFLMEYATRALMWSLKVLGDQSLTTCNSWHYETLCVMPIEESVLWKHVQGRGLPIVLLFADKQGDREKDWKKGNGCKTFEAKSVRLDVSV